MINPSKQKTEMLRKGCGTFSEWREHEKEKIDGIIDGCGDDDRHPVRVWVKRRGERAGGENSRSGRGFVITGECRRGERRDGRSRRCAADYHLVLLGE